MVLKIEGAVRNNYIMMMRPYMKVVPTWAVQIDEPFEIEVHTAKGVSGKVRASAGSWLAYTEREDNSHKLYPITDEEFRRTYKPAPEED